MLVLPNPDAGVYTVAARAGDGAGNTGLASTTLTVVDPRDINAPTVNITAPTDGAVIAAPVDVIGTVTDTNLLFYTLAVAPLGSSAFTEIFRGTSSITNGVLGKFDPTGLANDTYTLRLTAKDSGNQHSDNTFPIAIFERVQAFIK